MLLTRHLRPFKRFSNQIRYNCTNKCNDNKHNKIAEQLDNINTKLSHMCTMTFFTTALTLSKFIIYPIVFS